ncbi:MAG: DUF1285 domain-containing protein [Alphaproteobacteria bacterium]|nr:DUF1285 domain-containing protein [Alphaproteobacteria bacterium]
MVSKDQKVDFKILRDGTWYHEGAPIKRERLAKLFSDRALSVDEDGNYWLKTPFEKYPVQVEDVPFVIVGYEGTKLRTNMDEYVDLKDGARWELRGGIPYVEVRGGLYARIGRAVLYNMVEEFGTAIQLGENSFPLGEA